MQKTVFCFLDVLFILRHSYFIVQLDVSKDKNVAACWNMSSICEAESRIVVTGLRQFLFSRSEKYYIIRGAKWAYNTRLKFHPFVCSCFLVHSCFLGWFMINILKRKWIQIIKIRKSGVKLKKIMRSVNKDGNKRSTSTNNEAMFRHWTLEQLDNKLF
jgi:hypothetical protein